MGETTDQIERHIYDQRHELDDNIHELRHKVKDAVDWRVQTQERPWTMVGVAFGAGLLTSLWVARRRRGKSYRNGRAEKGNRESTSRSEHWSDRDEKTSHIWGDVKGAVTAVVVTAAKDFVEQVIPGFRETYRKRRGSDEGALLRRSA